jgi:putative addiction module killer protein
MVNSLPFEVLQSEVYSRWFKRLPDLLARARVDARIRRLLQGHRGDAKPVGGGVCELRIDYGPGYRVYFTQRGPVVMLLLCAGDKRTQSIDIVRAIEIAKTWSRWDAEEEGAQD